MKKYRITQTIKREAIIEAEDEEKVKDLLEYRSFGFAWQEFNKDTVITEVKKED